MTRSQRRWHSYLWLTLGPLLVLGLLVALSARAAVPIQSKAHATAGQIDRAAPSAQLPVNEGTP
jgi:hypothetical protein